MEYQENNKRTSTTTRSSSTTTVEFCQEKEMIVRNRAEQLRTKYSEVMGREMPPAVLRQLLLALLDGTPWQYYDYALDETVYAPAPSWRYVAAIVSRLTAQAVPVERIRDPKPRKQGKTVGHQDYTQREYVHTEDPMERMMREFMTEGR